MDLIPIQQTLSTINMFMGNNDNEKRRVRIVLISETNMIKLRVRMKVISKMIVITKVQK